MTSPWRDPTTGPVTTDPRRTVFPAAAPSAPVRAGWGEVDMDVLLDAIRMPLVHPAPVGDPALVTCSAPMGDPALRGWTA